MEYSGIYELTNTIRKLTIETMQLENAVDDYENSAMEYMEECEELKEQVKILRPLEGEVVTQELKIKELEEKLSKVRVFIQFIDKIYDDPMLEDLDKLNEIYTVSTELEHV